MDLATYRIGLGLSQQQVADELGLSARSKICEIESGAITPSLRLALRIERWSHGIVPAIDLVSPEDAELLRAALARAEPAEVAA